MARQTFYLTRDQRHPLYRTRMLQAGPIVLDAGAARLYRKLGVELHDEKPRPAARVETPAPAPIAKPQQDHDNDGKAGGSEKGAASTRAKGAAKKKAPAKRKAKAKAK